MNMNQVSAAPASEPNNEMERFLNRLHGMEKDAELIADRLQRIISRAFGEGAPNGKGASTAPMPAGSVAAVSASLSSIATSLAGASEAITRLDTLA